jgi:hypothetical protein
MNSVTHVGLDVHKDSTAVAVLRADAGEPDHRVVASTPEAYRKLVAGLGVEGTVFVTRRVHAVMTRIGS